MELSFNGGRFVSLNGELNYKEFLADFPTAKIIRILTYNMCISKILSSLHWSVGAETEERIPSQTCSPNGIQRIA